MDQLANNYEFSKALDAFEEREVKVLSQKLNEAFVILSDLNYKWKDADQKKAAEARYEAMEERYNFLRDFFQQGKKLARQHEELVDVISKIYWTWYEKVSYKGQQEKELMDEQVDILIGIFKQIYDITEPLKLNFKPPIK